MLNLKIINRVKNLRLKNKLSQEQFANSMLVTQGFISKIERGVCPPSTELLCRMYRCFPRETVAMLKKGFIEKEEGANSIHWFGGKAWLNQGDL